MLKFCPCKENKVARRHMSKLSRNVRKGIDQASRNSRKLIKDYTVSEMKKDKHGQTYTVYVGQGGRPLKRPILHVASSPNEMPAILTGRLKRSLQFSIKYGVSLTYGADTPYARRHEESGRTYIKRSLKAKEKDVYNELMQQIQRFVK